jgi:hypothetical protein
LVSQQIRHLSLCLEKNIAEKEEEGLKMDGKLVFFCTTLSKNVIIVTTIKLNSFNK